MTKFIKLFLAVILLAGCSKKNDESNLTVLTGGGEVSYTVEEAKTVPELEKGLMFRESLAPNAGMIFDLSKVEHTAMWMKNTKIPLDMIFIDGRRRHFLDLRKRPTRIPDPDYSAISCGSRIGN